MPLTEAEILAVLRPFMPIETPRTTPEIIAFLERAFPRMTEDEMRSLAPAALQTLARESLEDADELEMYRLAKFGIEKKH